MDIAVLLIGVSFIGIGFLVKRYPHSISGYNGLSREKKKNIDIDGLSTHYRNGLVMTGSVTILIYFVIKLVGFPALAQLIFMPVLMIGSILLIAGAFKYDHNRKKTNLKAGLWITVAATALICIILVSSYKPHKIIIENDSLRITGAHGITVKREHVERAELRDNLPAVGVRTNGSAIAGVLKGYFRVGDGMGKVLLFEHPSYNGPFLIIKTDVETIAVKTPDDSAGREYLIFMVGGDHSSEQN